VLRNGFSTWAATRFVGFFILKFFGDFLYLILLATLFPAHLINFLYFYSRVQVSIGDTTGAGGAGGVHRLMKELGA
jgi:hypothetical protein